MTTENLDMFLVLSWTRKSIECCARQGAAATHQGRVLQGGRQPDREAAADVQPGRGTTTAGRQPRQAHALFTPGAILLNGRFPVARLQKRVC